MTKTICVAIELVTIENFSAHDRAGVRGLGAQRHALGAHLTEVLAIEEFCQDREFSIITDFT